MKISVFVLAFAVGCVLAGAEVELRGDGIFASVLGHSGKIRIGRSEDSDETVTVDFTDLVEQNADDEDVGGNEHRFNTFANTDFTFSSILPCEFQGIKCQNVTFEAVEMIAMDTRLVVTLVLFNESGIISNDDEEIAVVAGSVKFNVELENWPFCDADGTGYHDCGGDEGDHINFSLELKAKGSASEDDDEFEYDGVTVVMSSKVRVDGEWFDMAEGYPMMETDGSKDIYTFQFPRATSSILYDPVFTMNASTVNRASVLSLSLCALVACLASFF